MSKNGNNSFWTSWPAIITLLIIFWPIGLFLLIKRISSDKSAAIGSGGKGLKITGIVLIVLGAFGIIGSFDPFNFGNLIIFIFFIAGGIVLMNKSKKIQAEAKSIKQYLSIIVNGNVRQLDTIAATTGESYEVVYNGVKNMIDKGYLKNAYINESTREVVLPSDTPSASQSTEKTAAVNTAFKKTKIVTCSCCGANNTVVGDNGECEYCGSPLK